MRNPTTAHTYRIPAILTLIAIAAILAFSAVITVSAQSDTPDWRLPVTGLTVTTGDDAGELDIAWDHHAQTTKTFLNYRVAWTPEGEDFKRADQTDWNVFTTGNQHTVTGLDAGATYLVKVRTRYEGNQGSRWTDVVTGQSGGAPTNTTPVNAPATGQPTIAGTPEVGETLTLATSSVSDDNGLANANFAYQWVRSADGTNTQIPRATGSTYLISDEDLGHSIKVQVSFTDDDGYSETLTSNATSTVPKPTSQNNAATGQPTVSGTAEVGETLTAETSAISDDNGLTNSTFNYQWVRSANGTDTDISGAMASSHLLSAEDLQHTIKVSVSFTDDDGYSETLTSQATDVVITTPNVAATGQPTIAGTTEVGETLTAGTSAIADANGLTNAVFSHQWVRNSNGTDTNISGATGSTYTVTNADIDKAIKVRVSFTDDEGHSETLTSNATASVPVPAPVIVPPEEPQIAQQASDAEATPVLNDWSLKPSGLGVDDSFRLIFLSSTKRNASSTSIGAYNTFVQNRAEAGHDDIQAFSDGFAAVGCTHAKDARDNTATTYTSSDKGVPIYWLGGNKVADEYEDFYDGSWSNEANDKNELGANGPDTSNSNNYPVTGCGHDGTEKFLTVGGTPQSRSLGSSLGVTVARPNSTATGHGPVSSGFQIVQGAARPMYGLSAVFTIVDQLPPITLVSNTGQTRSNESGAVQSQPFTTGSNLGGYTLTSVDVGFQGDNVRTRLFHIVPNKGNGEPDLSDPTKFITLTTPRTTTADKIHTFAAPADARLAANTTYHLLLANSDGGVPGNIHRVSSQAEDDGGAPGWSIGNKRYWRNGNTGPWSDDTANIVRMQINGRNALPSTDATLSGLDLVRTTDSQTVSLSPAFDDDTFTYTAAVPNGIAAITLTAATTHSGAMIAITDDDDDNTKNEAVLDLNVGDNTLTLTVTAEDTSVTETYSITVTRERDPTQPVSLPVIWSLIPSGLSDGDQFRLLFLSGTRRDGSSSVITDYNTFVRGRAAAGHTDIQAYSDGFMAVGCTEAVDARDNTGTTYTSTDKGVPIYWLDGNKVADDYEDFYDGDWDDESNDKNEDGNNGPNTSDSANYPLTGCSADGTEKISGTDSSALGNGGDVTVARPNSSGTGDGPLSSGQKIDETFTRPMYALSQVFTVTEPADCPTDATWCTSMLVRNTTTTTSIAKYDFSGYNITEGSGTLGSTTFTHESTSYTINRLQQTTLTALPANTISLRNFYLKAEPALPAGTILTLGDRSFTIGDESENPTAGQEEWDTIDNPLNWTNRQDVTVSLQLLPDATLSNIEIEGTADGQTVVLSPAFDDDTLTYTARVGNGIDQVTLTATKNDSNATVVITNDDDTRTPDTADLDLIVGSNTLAVTVTAMDTTTTTATLTYTITVTRAESGSEMLVPGDWGLVPTGLSAGASFRLLFLSSTRHDASSASIDTYNTFVQGRAANGHTDIQAYSDGFTVVGCTQAVDARDNTSTRHDSADRGVPIYWLNGNKVADEYQDFYDGSWDDEANDKNQSGNNGPDTSDNEYYPLTGCDHNGTEKLNSALGSAGVTVARPNSTDTGHGPLSSGFQLTATNTRPMYGISAVFTIVELSDATLSGLDLAGTADGETITLIPVFDEDTLTYTATVAYETDAVTLTVAKNNRNATVAITGDDDTSTKNEADLDLSVGANTLTVTVTAEDTIATETYTITVTRAIAPPPDTETVPHTWSLVPTGLSGDDEFQLLFLSSTKRDARSANIDNYDTFIQDLAADGHTDIKAYSHGFRAVGCTADTDARDNTATTFTSSDKGVPIYWLDGNKVANQYQDFYDGSWDDEANDKNEFGNDAHDTSQTANYPWTGCNPDGTEAFISSTSYALGESSVIAGQPNSSTSGNGPINSSISRSNSNTQPMYGLSQVFRVDTPTYVSNLKQSQQSTVSAFSKRSQTFTTGPNTSYIISHVDLASGGTTGTVSVDIHETNPDGTPTETIKHSLTAPPSLNGSPLRFAAPTSATLDGDTTYAIVVTPSSANFSFLTTTSNDEDTAEPGWSIRNTHHFETPDPMTGLMVWAIRHGNTSLKIAVKGTTPAAPDAPTNLRATANGTNQIDLSWDTPGESGGATITGYKIEFSPNGNTNWTSLVVSTGNANTTYSDTGLSPSTTRYYRTLAINSAGTGPASNVANATTDAAAEGTVSFGPGSFTASENGAAARVTVELSVPTSATIPLRVQHRNGATSADYSGVPRRLIFEDGTTIRSFTVTAVDDSDNDDGEKLRIEFYDLPAGFEAGAHSSITVKLKDNDGGNSLPLFDPANELRNLIENTPANQDVGLPITATDADGDSLSYTFDGPDMDRFTFVPSTAQIQTKSGQTYDYETHQLFVVRVTADDGNGGTKTATVVIRVRDVAEPPQAPTGLTLVQAYPTSMLLSWTPPDNTGRPAITGYDLQYKKSTESAWTAGPQGLTDTSDSITGLDPSTSYHVQVRANNDDGNGPWSSTLSRSTPSSSPDISITKTTLTVTEGDQTGRIYLIVLGSQPTADVHIYISGYDATTVAPHNRSKTFNTGNWNAPRQVLLRTIEDADTTDEVVTITHRVESDDTDYEGIAVPDLTVNVIDNDTPQVTGVWTQPGDRQLTINWTATDKATGYKVQWKAPGDNYNTYGRMATITSGSTTTYTIPNLTNGTEYKVMVTATWTGHSDGPRSDEATGTPTATP